MATDKTTAQEDLAFLRRLVSTDGDGAAQRAFGQMYAIWGAAFSLPMFVQWLGMIGVVRLPDWYWTAAAAVITILLLAVTIRMGRRTNPSVGVQARAWRAVFAGVGWANVAVLLALGLVSASLKDGRVMMLQAVVVFAFQGAAWYVVWALRRIAWTGLVAAGWYLCAAGLGAAIPDPSFVLLGSVGLFVLMVGPGLALARANPRAG
jgi:hypothetical protein